MTPDEQTALDIMVPTEPPRTVDPRSMPVRFTHLSKMSRSPAHYIHSLQSGWEETLAMRLGSGAHAMLFGQPWIVFPGKVRNGKVWDAFERDNADKVILNRSEYVKARALSEAVKRHERAYELLFDRTKLEHQLNWSYLGRACSSRLDSLGSNRITELKSTKCAEPGRFARDGRWRFYHAQTAFYQEAVVEQGLGTRSDPVFIVAVESLPPHPVTVLRLTERALELGRKLCRIWFEQLLSCEAEDYWPGYVQSDATFDIPDDDTELVVDGETISLSGGANDNAPLLEEVSDDEELF